MSTATLEQHRTGASFVGFAAWIAMAGAVLQFVLGIPLAYLQAETPPSAAIVALNILHHLLLMVGIVGLARSQAAGGGWLGKGGLSLSQLGFALLVVAEASWLFSTSATETLFGLATLVLLLGLILAGIAGPVTTQLDCGAFAGSCLVCRSWPRQGEVMAQQFARRLRINAARRLVGVRKWDDRRGWLGVVVRPICVPWRTFACAWAA